MTVLCHLSIANCTWSSDNNARGWKLLHEQASFAYFFVLCLIELKMNAVKLPCFMPEWNKRKRICFECHNCLPLNFPAKGQFIDAVDLNTELSGLNLTEIKAEALGKKKNLYAFICSFSSLKVKLIVVIHSQSFLSMLVSSSSSDLEVSLVLVI